MQKISAWIACGLLGACSAAINTTQTDATVDAQVEVRTPRTGPVSYYEHVRPVLTQNCAGCHQAGGIGGFDLTTYESARARSASIGNATASRRMPPFLADNSGSCNTYRDALWLTDDNLDVLRLWGPQRPLLASRVG